MKKLFFLSLFCCLSLLVACGGGASALQGNWSVDVEATTKENGMNAEGQKLGAQLANAALSALLNGTSLELKADKTALFKFGGNQISGKWDLGDNGKAILIKNNDGETLQEIKILKQSAKQLHVSIDGKQKMSIGKGIVLKKD